MTLTDYVELETDLLYAGILPRLVEGTNAHLAHMKAKYLERDILVYQARIRSGASYRALGLEFGVSGGRIGSILEKVDRRLGWFRQANRQCHTAWAAREILDEMMKK